MRSEVFTISACPFGRSRRYESSPFPGSDAQPSPPAVPRTSPPRLCRSPSLVRQNGVRLPDFAKLIESPPNPSPRPGRKHDSGDFSSESLERQLGQAAPAIRWQENPDAISLDSLDPPYLHQTLETFSAKSLDQASCRNLEAQSFKSLDAPSFKNILDAPGFKNHLEVPPLPPLDIGPRHHHRQSSNISDPESPVSPLLTSDPRRERSHSKNYTRTISELVETEEKHESPEIIILNKPSLARLARLSSPEWFCALLGSMGAALFGSFNPLFGFIVSELVDAYYNASGEQMKTRVSKWCLVIMGMGFVTVVVNFLQHFYFGIMGEKMTERVRRLMFSGMHPACRPGLSMYVLSNGGRGTVCYVWNASFTIHFP